MTQKLKTIELDKIDWSEIGTTICEIISSFKANKKGFEKAAKDRGTNVDSLMAASIAGMLQEHLEKHATT